MGEKFILFIYFSPILHIDGHPQPALAKLTWLPTIPSRVVSVSLSASVGGESLAVAQNTYAVNWFKGKELNLVFGLQLSMARLVRTS